MDIDPQSGVLRWRDETDRSMHQASASLVVGADGAGSALRNALHDRGLLRCTEEVLAHDYKELHVPAANGGGWVLEPHALHVWPRGGYMLIALPNPDG
jgi:kynurenine 3-monooxygenase